jgi:hypothetical protein
MGDMNETDHNDSLSRELVEGKGTFHEMEGREDTSQT